MFVVACVLHQIFIKTGLIKSQEESVWGISDAILPPLPARPKSKKRSVPKDLISDEEFAKRETLIKKYYNQNKSSNPGGTLLRQISGPYYINELGKKSSIDWVNMYIHDLHKLREYSDQQENLKKCMIRIITFAIHYRYESEHERLPLNYYKGYVNKIYNICNPN